MGPAPGSHPSVDVVMRLLLVGTFSSALRRSLSDVEDLDIVDVVGLGPLAVAAAIGIKLIDLVVHNLLGA